jgi:hypothetical protein
VWRRTGDDSYSIQVFEQTPTGQKLLWSMEMKRVRARNAIGPAKPAKPTEPEAPPV